MLGVGPADPNHQTIVAEPTSMSPGSVRSKTVSELTGAQKEGQPVPPWTLGLCIL